MRPMAIKVTTFADLLRYINAASVHELIALFIAIKFKDDEGQFDRERLVDFFMELFIILQKEGIFLGKSWAPIQAGDRENVVSLLNEQPINSLLKSKIFKTADRFEFNLFKEIFNNEEAVLVAVKEQLIRYFLGRGVNSRPNLEATFSNWEGTMNEMIKTNALMRITEGYSKFTLEFLLKFLYQSYSLGAFEKLVADHQINQKELIDYFNSRLEFPIERVGGLSIPVRGGLEEGEEPEVLGEQPPKKSAEEHLQSLTDFFHTMREEGFEKGKKKKKKKK